MKDHETTPADPGVPRAHRPCLKEKVPTRSHEESKGSSRGLKLGPQPWISRRDQELLNVKEFVIAEVTGDSFFNVP